MKDINFRDLVTLENGEEYACFGTVDYNGDKYICLIKHTTENKKDFLFAKQVLIDNYASLEIIEDEDTLKQIKTLLMQKYKINTLK